VPRVINVICDRALLGAYSLDRHRVTPGLVRSAATEVFGRRFSPHWLPWAATAGIALLMLGALVLLWSYQPWNHHAPAAAPAARAASGEAAAAVPVAQPQAAPSAPPVPRLAQLLTQYAAETDTDSAFAKLFALWGAKYQPSSTDPCAQATQQGLECVSERGSF